MEIIPAILEPTWLEVEKKIKLVDGLTDWIQLDVSDGVFTPVKTWSNPGDLLGLNIKSKLEIHLMVSNPAEEIKKWAVDPVSRLVVPVEFLGDVKPPTFNNSDRIVLGFNMETSWEMYQDLIVQFGRVLFLSVSPGYQGQEFDRRVIDKIKSFKSAYPQVKIEVDGGISSSVIGDLKSAGADALVIGSAIFSASDPKQAIENLKKLAG